MGANIHTAKEASNKSESHPPPEIYRPETDEREGFHMDCPQACSLDCEVEKRASIDRVELCKPAPCDEVVDGGKAKEWKDVHERSLTYLRDLAHLILELDHLLRIQLGRGMCEKEPCISIHMSPALIKDKENEIALAKKNCFRLYQMRNQLQHVRDLESSLSGRKDQSSGGEA